MQVDVSSAGQAVQIAAILTRLDTGSGTAQIRFYSTDMPSAVGTHSDTPMCTFTLPKPCGVITAGVLAWADAPAAMVMSEGMPRWAEVVAADGEVIFQADATDADNGGFFQCSGAPTPDGEASPLFYAGGLMVLGDSAVT